MKLYKNVSRLGTIFLLSAVLQTSLSASDWSAGVEYSYASFHGNRDHQEYDRDLVHKATKHDYVPSLSISKAFLDDYELRIQYTKYDNILTDVIRVNSAGAFSVFQFRVTEDIDEYTIQLNKRFQIRKNIRLAAGVSSSYLGSSYLKYMKTDGNSLERALKNGAVFSNENDWSFGFQAKVLARINDLVDLSLGYRYTKLFEVETHLTSLSIDIKI